MLYKSDSRGVFFLTESTIYAKKATPIREWLTIRFWYVLLVTCQI